MKRPPEAPTFFVDIDLGIHFFTDLSADGRFNVEFHDTHFPGTGTDDADWLRLIAERGWIGVTRDKKIRNHHRAIIAGSKASVIIVVGRRPLADQAANFLTTYPRIERFTRGRQGPYLAKLFYPTPKELKKLKPTGRIELWGNWS